MRLRCTCTLLPLELFRVLCKHFCKNLCTCIPVLQFSRSTSDLVSGEQGEQWLCFSRPVAGVVLRVLRDRSKRIPAPFENKSFKSLHRNLPLPTPRTAMLIEEMWGREMLPLFYTKVYKRHAKMLFPRISGEL